MVNVIWLSVIGDGKFDNDTIDKLIMDIENGGTFPVGIIADTASRVGDQAISYAKNNSRKFISLMPVDIKNQPDQKLVYERNHKMIKESDVVLIFREQRSSASTENAIRYTRKLKKKIYVCKI